MNLYTKFAQDFSKTRQAPWKGWEKLTELINSLNLNSYRILDIGCGNGRFLNFLLDQSFLKNKESMYLGIDNSNELLVIAKEKYLIKKPDLSNIYFKFVDIQDDNWNDKLKDIQQKRETKLQVTNNFNIIVAFGLMHHIKSLKDRIKFYIYCEELLSKGGLLIITYWQFMLFERYKKIIIASYDLKGNPLLKTELNHNDYLLSFGKDKNTFRFCHFYDNQEITELEKNTKLNKIMKYSSDGKENNQNLYLIYQSSK